MTMKIYHRNKRGHQAVTPSTFTGAPANSPIWYTFLLTKCWRDVLLPSKAKISSVCLFSSLWVFIGILLPRIVFLLFPPFWLLPILAFPHTSFPCLPPHTTQYCDLMSFLLCPASTYSFPFTATFLEDKFTFIVPTSLSPISCRIYCWIASLLNTPVRWLLPKSNLLSAKPMAITGLSSGSFERLILLGFVFLAPLDGLPFPLLCSSKISLPLGSLLSPLFLLNFR